MRWGLITTGLVFVAAGCASDRELRLDTYTSDGLYLFQRGDFDGAGRCFEAARALAPGDPNLTYNLGECAYRRGDLARAEALYTECLRAAPNHAECRHALTVLLLRHGRRDEATKMVADWLAKEPNLPGPYAEDGYILREEGDLISARARYQQALEKDPHDRGALLHLALLYEAMQRNDYAVSIYDRLIDLEPTRDDVVRRRNVLVSQGAKPPRPE